MGPELQKGNPNHICVGKPERFIRVKAYLAGVTNEHHTTISDFVGKTASEEAGHFANLGSRRYDSRESRLAACPRWEDRVKKLKNPSEATPTQRHAKLPPQGSTQRKASDLEGV